MSAKRIKKDGGMREPRRDAKLLRIGAKQRELILGWLETDGVPSCLQRIASQFQIQCGQTTLYEAVAFWRSELRNDKVRAMAVAQIERESQEKQFTPQEKLMAIDRARAEIHAEQEDWDAYEAARYQLMKAESDQTKAELEKAKLALKTLAESRSKEALKLEREKFETGIRTKVEAGLAEIAKQVKGNAKAESALAKLMEEIKA